MTNELARMEEKHWAVKMELHQHGKIVQAHDEATDLTMIEAKVKQNEIEARLIEEGWVKQGFTLQKRETHEIIFMAVRWRGPREVESLPF